MTKDHNTEQAVSDLLQPSVFLPNVHHAYAQIDGTYSFPNSREGDMLKTAKREIEELRAALSRVRGKAQEPMVVPGGFTPATFHNLKTAKIHAKIAADDIVEFSKNRPGGMCGWLDDACTHADIAANMLNSMLAAAPQVAQEEGARGAVLQEALYEPSEAGDTIIKSTPTLPPHDAPCPLEFVEWALRMRDTAADLADRIRAIAPQPDAQQSEKGEKA